MSDDPAAELSAKVIAAARPVRVLSHLSWPEGAVQGFLDSWTRGAPELPSVPLPSPDLDASVAELEVLSASADRGDPLQAYAADTAESYARAGRMVKAAGTSGFTAHSRAIYGSPSDALPGSETTHRQAAEQLLTHTDNLTAAGVLSESELCLTAETVKQRLEKAFAAFFGDAAPRVVVDPDLASKAAAGSRRIRIRGSTCFSEVDVVQLIEHEGFVHAATALNGRAQPILDCMRLSAPRTTFTQEGIATLAELTTRAIDIARLRRLALRTVAIDMALEGADFLEVFRFFLEAGQDESESARSSMRVFRGGDVRGGVVFTKDVVYLAGLFEVHAFLRKAITESQPHLVRRLFAGRLALTDVVALAPAFAEGRLAEPRFVPRWATELHRLAAFLAFNAVADHIDLGAIRLG